MVFLLSGFDLQIIFALGAIISAKSFINNVTSIMNLSYGAPLNTWRLNRRS